MASVYAVPDPLAGDQVMATLVFRAGGRFEPGAFAAFLAGQPDLGTKWSPRFVRVASDLPLTASGKVVKAPLRAAGWLVDDPVWWRPDPRDAGFRLLDNEGRGRLEAEFREHGRTALLG